MKKPRTKKLVLDHQTIRPLAAPELTVVVGGGKVGIYVGTTSSAIC